MTGDQLTQWDVSGEMDDDVQRMLQEAEPDRGDTAAKAGYADSELHRRQIEEFVAAVQENRPPAMMEKRDDARLRSCALCTSPVSATRLFRCQSRRTVPPHEGHC